VIRRRSSRSSTSDALDAARPLVRARLAEPGATPLGEFFDELEFDRYDDFNLLARSRGRRSRATSR